MKQRERRIYLIQELLKENQAYSEVKIPETSVEQKQLLRGLMNIRLPRQVGEEFLKIQDEYLQEEIRRKGITETDSLIPVQEEMYLWQGDITTLRCDAIVNAANSQMLGCFCPNHGCIDNAIHTFSGIQLREACAKLMEEQGQEKKQEKPKSHRHLICLVTMSFTPLDRLLGGGLQKMIKNCWLPVIVPVWNWRKNTA